MRRACERGCKVFDYGRSKVGTGPYSFKKNWGFEPQALSYEYRLYKCDAIPQNNPMNPKYRAFIALWKYKQDIMKVISACAVIGLVFTYLR